MDPHAQPQVPASDPDRPANSPAPPQRPIDNPSPCPGTAQHGGGGGEAKRASSMDPDKIIVRNELSAWAKFHPGEPGPPPAEPAWLTWWSRIFIAACVVLMLSAASLLLYVLL